MRDAILIENISETELREIFRGVVQKENDELTKEVALLREELRRNRTVITHRVATTYFDFRVAPATVIEYIKFCGLPAFKQGRQWFIYTKDLMDFQIGLIGHASTKKDGIKRVIAPRHRENRTTAVDTRRNERQKHVISIEKESARRRRVRSNL